MKNDVELGKLSVYYNIIQDDIDITLVGFANKPILDINLDVLHNGLTEKEMRIYEDIQEMFFKGIAKNICHWEGVELEEYNKAMKLTK